MHKLKQLQVGNPLILDKFKIDTEVQKLQDKERNYNATKYRLEDSIKNDLPLSINLAEDIIQRLEIDIENRKEKEPEDNCHITINGKEFNTYKDAGAEMLEFANQYLSIEKEYELGEYRGFNIVMCNKGMGNLLNNVKADNRTIIIKGKYEHYFELAKVPSLNIKKLNDIIDKLDEMLENQKKNKIDYERQLEQAKKELEKPFEFEKKLKELLQKQAEINKELNMEEDEKNIVVVDEYETEEIQEIDEENTEEIKEYEIETEI